jgi:hypothetical protein
MCAKKTPFTRRPRTRTHIIYIFQKYLEGSEVFTEQTILACQIKDKGYYSGLEMRKRLACIGEIRRICTKIGISANTSHVY